MLLLGVDSSLALLSVALLRDRDLSGAMALEGKSSRNEKLLPAIDWLLTESGIERSAIDLFAVTRGPGSFTGVRIGLATVQGLALALGKPVCAMSTHEAIAGDSSVAVADDAGRGEFYVSRFGRDPEPPHLSPEAPSDAIHVSQFIETHNVAAHCARRAFAIAVAGELAKYADATPIYVRLAEAEVKLQPRSGG
ncbi:MAG TPA: tRNA (adenosine(37)-N6)-threonylcarbamoyltransferase complex dimerization subunit type 1 TsaB [Thermoanaerobaculia bacterium]|nr:tRNA (adenosine(37)-N6)-threonylcarbamoyltransferase complex dimerization subunit type 1 TsaB [Thermoanaerobaculia bacterium]